VGRRVGVGSPQGRFAAEAAALDGHVVDDIEPYGKHLLYRFDNATVHVHLGLYGQFHVYDAAAAPPPTPGTRLQISVADKLLRLAGPTACELFTADDEARLLARLGPDPLRDDYDQESVWRALQRRTTPIGAVLMDQKVLAGVGSAFRSEALFVCRIAPLLPADALSRRRFNVLNRTLVTMLHEGVRAGRIATVAPEHDNGVDSRYVYRRAGLPCLRCGTPIRPLELAARTAYYCPRCQRR
jgi:endonuclease VIII